MDMELKSLIFARRQPDRWQRTTGGPQTTGGEPLA